MKAYEHIIKFALSCDYTVSVWDGEEWTKSDDYAEIVDAVESVEEAILKIRREGGDSIASATVNVTVSAYGLEPDPQASVHDLWLALGEIRKITKHMLEA